MAQKLIIQDSIELSSVILPMYINHDYNTILILDKNLKLLVNLNNEFLPDQNELDNVKKAFESNHIQNSEIDKNEYSDKDYFDFYIPIYEKEKPLAVIILSVAPSRLLFTFLQSDRLGGKTIESILFKRKNNFLINLSQLKYNNIAPLNLKIPVDKNNWTASLTPDSMNMVRIFNDYRREKVLADIRYIKDANCYLITKIDTAEIYQSLNFKVIASGVIIFLIIGFTSVLIFYYRNRQELFNIDKLNKSEIKYRQIIEYASEGIVIFDKSLNIIQVNSVACHDLGYTSEELMRKKIPNLLRPYRFK